jgi:hypothetical protein
MKFIWALMLVFCCLLGVAKCPVATPCSVILGKNDTIKTYMNASGWRDGALDCIA